MSRYEDNNRRERNYGTDGRNSARPSRDSQRKRSTKKKKGSAAGTFLITLILVIALGVFCYAAFTLYGYYREYKAGTDEYGSLNDRYVSILPGTETTDTKTEDAQAGGGQAPVLENVEELENPATLEEKVEAARKEDVTEDGQEKSLPVLKNPVNFTELQAINEDIIGWIRIGALDLSYPVAQGEDNDYYLHRTFERVDNFAGCIFLNCDNTRYFTDQNSIVYGHNMKNGSMFGTLNKFQNQETYEDCPYFWIFTPEFIYQYRIFSCSLVNKIGDPYRTRFTTEDFQTYINNSQAASMIDNGGVEVTTEDRIVTLSTCTGDDSTRLIVQGKLAHVYVSN